MIKTLGAAVKTTCLLLLISCAAPDSLNFPSNYASFASSPIQRSSHCDPSAEAIVYRMRENGLRYCGRITQHGVALFNSMLRAGDERIVISSVGGELEHPLNLAFLVLEKNLDVEVVGPCFSGCAAFVFIAGNQRIISPTGVLGFHNTNSSVFEMSRKLLVINRELNISALKKRRRQEIELYKAANIGLDLLYEPQIRIRTVCIEQAGRKAISNEVVFNIASELDLLSPTNSLLNYYGVHIEGYSANSIPDAKHRLSAGTNSNSIQPKFSLNPNSKKISNMQQRLQEVGLCAENQH